MDNKFIEYHYKEILFECKHFYKHCYKYCDFDDYVQDVLIEILRNPFDESFGMKPFNYILMNAKNIALRTFKYNTTQKRKAPPMLSIDFVHDEFNEDNLLIYNEDFSSVYIDDLIIDLNEIEQKVFDLLIQDVTIKDIAKQLNVTTSYVYKIRNQIRNKLK